MQDGVPVYGGLTYGDLDELIRRLYIWGYSPRELGKFCADLDATEGGQMKIKNEIARLKSNLAKLEASVINK